ncbi:MAG: DUF4160 domain-containing protein [Gammaproteobacteria bacterium]|nr:DUF4160 domain-containing protein [Gammaproteobacteria bacterium]
MPKLYEYFGLIVMFYANEHETIHVHGKCQGRESRAEIVLINGLVHEISYTAVTGRAPLEPNEMRFFQEHFLVPNAPAWECIPILPRQPRYGFPRRTVGTRIYL